MCVCHQCCVWHCSAVCACSVRCDSNIMRLPSEQAGSKSHTKLLLAYFVWVDDRHLHSTDCCMPLLSRVTRATYPYTCTHTCSCMHARVDTRAHTLRPAHLTIRLCLLPGLPCESSKQQHTHTHTHTQTHTNTHTNTYTHAHTYTRIRTPVPRALPSQASSWVQQTATPCRTTTPPSYSRTSKEKGLLMPQTCS